MGWGGVWAALQRRPGWVGGREGGVSRRQESSAREREVTLLELDVVWITAPHRTRSRHPESPVDSELAFCEGWGQS